MSEFDELVSRQGVVVAGRFGPDWHIAEHKSVGMLIEDPRVFELMSSFTAAIQTLLNTMAVAMSDVAAVSWQPVKGWAVWSGPYSVLLHGDRFVVAETEKVGSVDELRHLLQERTPVGMALKRLRILPHQIERPPLSSVRLGRR
jgi:roadblock/LC7 domain-containing protein